MTEPLLNCVEVGYDKIDGNKDGHLCLGRYVSCNNHWYEILKIT